MAEGIMLKLISDKNLSIEIDSAGTSNFHVGETPDYRTVLNAKKHDVDLTPLKARQFSEKDFDDFDSIYVMDKSNMTNVLALAKNEEQEQKVEFFLNTLFPNQNMEVPDPYFGGEEGFEHVFNLVYSACEKMIEKYSN